MAETPDNIVRNPGDENRQTSTHGTGVPTVPEGAPTGGNPVAPDEDGVAGTLRASTGMPRGHDGRFLPGITRSPRPLTSLDQRRAEWLAHLGDGPSVAELALAEDAALTQAQMDQLGEQIAREGPTAKNGRIRATTRLYLKLAQKLERSVRILGLKSRKAGTSLDAWMKSR